MAKKSVNFNVSDFINGKNNITLHSSTQTFASVKYKIALENSHITDEDIKLLCDNS
jgi:hypothetical protein